jgi:hypothetical protein
VSPKRFSKPVHLTAGFTEAGALPCTDRAFLTEVEAFGVALNEKQVPQFVGNNRNGSRKMTAAAAHGRTFGATAGNARRKQADYRTRWINETVITLRFICDRAPSYS